ncbi:FkbM family methyltransferase [Rhizobium sp. P32RR-XVIII]|uniref:FkbM family methyltransferase n=1 Tax=Rhizobium sp. P32RR-XVIII TaxID=2726738 RepID=UPI001456476E|nr:FkbM family methyltransferase [Rhizobium sp. P32RR-XVIII]NLS07945.1 FkbM family methyltransferase [Rhizobium sp. P32RR-XVIII]
MPRRGKFFYFIIKSMDVFQRIYMRLYTILSPSSEAYTVFDARMLCNSRDFVQRRIRFFGIFEHNLTHFTLSRLKQGDGYADIGANVGYYSLLASKKVGADGIVVSVEADPTTFTRLQTNLSLNDTGNVRALNVAATEEPCTISIRKGTKHNAGANAVAVDASGTIPGLPLKRILGDDIGKINFIKIDIEGSEGPVLKSILDDVDRFPADLIVASEVSDDSSEFVEKFIRAGFRAYAISNIYTVDYYLISSYLRRIGDPSTFDIVETNRFLPGQNDYVFERMHA